MSCTLVRANVAVSTTFDPPLTAGRYALYRSKFAGGDGSEGSPFQVTDWEGLKAISDDLDKHYALAADITVPEGQDWTPIGTSGSPFTGSLDGNDHTIEGINITGTSHLGLFGEIEDGEVKDLTIKGTISGGRYLGMLAGRTVGSTITNVRTVVDITSTVDPISSGAAGASDTGGLIGEAITTVITGSSTEGKITGNGRDIGGLVGYLSNPNVSPLPTSEIRRSYSTVNITHTSSQPGTGGLVGGLQRGGSIYDSYATGEVQGTANVGGLVGRINNSACEIVNSYSVGKVPSSGSGIGGLLGSNSSPGGTITSSYWDTQTSGTTSSAGGQGRSTAQMKQQTTFDGWDFTDIWEIDAKTHIN